MKQSKFKIVIGILLLPLVFATFMADRIILLAIFWVDAPSIGTWIAKDKLWSMSIVRIVITGVIFGLFSLINWLI